MPQKLKMLIYTVAWQQILICSAFLSALGPSWH